MSVALIVVIALVIAAVTGIKIYLENREVKSEASTTVTLPSETKAEETITVNQPIEAPAINEVEAPITDKTVDAPVKQTPAFSSAKPKTGKKPFKKKPVKK